MAGRIEKVFSLQFLFMASFCLLIGGEVVTKFSMLVKCNNFLARQLHAVWLANEQVCVRACVPSLAICERGNRGIPLNTRIRGRARGAVLFAPKAFVNNNAIGIIDNKFA